ADYPAREVYDPIWVAAELGAGTERETWIAEEKGSFLASISFLSSVATTHNPVANLGRCLFHTDSYLNGVAQRMVERVCEAVAERRQLAVVRVPVADRAMPSLVEGNDFTCVGFQPA